MAVPAPQYVHVSCFTSCSSFECELVNQRLKLEGLFTAPVNASAEGVSVLNLTSLAQWGRVTHSLLVKPLSSLIAPVGKLYGRQGRHYLNANVPLRSITLAVSNHI